MAAPPCSADLAYGFRIRDEHGDDEFRGPNKSTDEYAKFPWIEMVQNIPHTAKCPVMIMSHGTSDCRCYALVVEESWQSIETWDTLELRQKLEAKPEWSTTLEQFCTEHNIPFVAPQFLLTTEPSW
ncbi:MAG TPA: hypothetical protein VLA04_05350 [Verrucomicrobiae bacterium]|nr:hypothetical protein [Verrucomicrobiae bacterium]